MPATEIVQLQWSEAEQGLGDSEGVQGHGAVSLQSSIEVLIVAEFRQGSVAQALGQRKSKMLVMEIVELQWSGWERVQLMDSKRLQVVAAIGQWESVRAVAQTRGG